MSAWPDLWCLFVVFLNYNFEADAVYHIKTTCEYGMCLALHGSNNTGGINFGNTRRACEELDRTVAAITDASVQDTVQRLLSGVPDIDDVWTAGIRRQNDAWSYMNGSSFGESPDIPGEDEGYCIFMRPGQMTSLTRDQCNEPNGKSYPFCQFTPTRSDSCSTLSYPGILYKDTCYYVHNQQPGDGGWYDAQTFCHIQLGGDLAHRHILDTGLMEQLAVNRDLWIGVNKYRWDWYPKTDEFFPMHHFNWGSGFDESLTEGRVAISSGDFTWKIIAGKLKHFMCAYVDETYTTTVPTTTTAVSVTTTQTTSVEQDISTASGSDVTTDLYHTTAKIDTSKQFSVGAVAGSVCAAVVVVAFGFVVVFLLRRKKRKDKQHPRSSHVYVNKGVSSAKHGAGQDHEPELDYESVEGGAMGGGYSSVDLDQADNTDQITPYGEYKPTATKEPSTTFFQNTRPKAQATDRDEETPEVAIYAQPNKPAKGKKTTEGTRPKHKPTIRTGKPNLGSKKAAQAEVTHVEAPSGDIYAVSARSVGAKQQTSDVLDVL